MKSVRVALCIVLFPFIVFAQSGTEQQGTTLLPDINPQDIEIKGDYRIRFPGLQRQPILGFDPRQRVFQLDPNRLPFLETNDEVVASIPISPLAIPASPVREFAKRPEVSNWWILGGFGLRQAPEGELGFAFLEPSNYRMSGFFSHLSSPDLGFTVPSSFSDTKGRFTYTEVISKGFNWNLSVKGSLTTHQNPLNATTTAEATAQQLFASTELKKVSNSWQSWLVKANYGLFNHSIDMRANDQIEHKAGLAMERNWTLSEPQTGMGMGFDIQAINNQVETVVNTIVLVKTYIDYKNDASGDFKYSFGVNPYYSSDNKSNGFYIYPKLDLTWYGFLGATLRAGAFGEVNTGGRQHYFETNRFLNVDQSIYTNRGIVLFANYEVDLMERSSIYGGFDLKRFTHFGFMDYEAYPSVAGQFNHVIRYDEAQIVKLKGGFSYRFDAPELSFNTEAWILNHQLQNGSQIPYLERFGAKSSMLWFIQKNWYFQPEIEFLAGRQGLNTTSAIFLVHAKTRYSFNKHWAIYAKALNLTGSSYSYWSEFRELPLFLTGGLNLTF